MQATTAEPGQPTVAACEAEPAPDQAAGAAEEEGTSVVPAEAPSDEIRAEQAAETAPMSDDDTEPEEGASRVQTRRAQTVPEPANPPAAAAKRSRKAVAFPAIDTAHPLIAELAARARTADPATLRPFASCHVGGDWASRDLEHYRMGYPGERLDNKRLQDNYLFYSNRLASRPQGGLIEDMHRCANDVTCGCVFVTGGRDWKGNYTLLEMHHGYIQWLFPIHEVGTAHCDTRCAILHDALHVARDQPA